MKKIKLLFKWIKPHSFLFIVISILVIILPLTYSYVPQFIRYIFALIGHETEGNNTLPTFLIDLFNSFTGIKCIFVVCITLIIFQAIRGLLMYLNGYLKGRFSESVSYDIRNVLYKQIQDLPTTYFNNADTGDLIQRSTSDIETIRGFISNMLPNILFILTSVISGAIQMASININIMFVTLICLPVTLISSIIFFRYVSKKFEEIEEYEANMTSVLEGAINGVRVVKAFAKERYEISRFDEKNKLLTNENKKLNQKMGIYWGFSDGFIGLQYAITIGYCIYLAQSGLKASDLIICISYISMLVYPVRNLGRIISNFGKATVASRRINDILSVESEYSINGSRKDEIKGDIEFNNVSFKFDDTDDYLFENVSFKINKGETVAFIGKTGSGKSTIANILVRMVEYTKGSIKIDGIELKEFDKKHLRESIGFILQEPYLYKKTIMENIGIKNSQNQENIYIAAKIASIHEDILQFDKGYDTEVGEKGVTLSGGQKQRISIARMLTLNKNIYIFDDSLSAVDTKTDYNIRKALHEANKDITTIIITHRITTAMKADKIIVFDKGGVESIGTHEELINKNGVYRDLWNIQGNLENEFEDLVAKEVS